MVFRYLLAHPACPPHGAEDDHADPAAGGEWGMAGAGRAPHRRLRPYPRARTRRGRDAPLTVAATPLRQRVDGVSTDMVHTDQLVSIKGASVLAASVSVPSPEDPLSALAVGQIPPREPAPGWVRVRLRAASLNQHDVWCLRGAVAPPPGVRLVLGMDAAGTTDTGEEVIVHAVLGDPARGHGDETLDPDRTMLPDQGWGTLAEEVVVPMANLLPKPRELSWVEAACLPTAWLTAYRMLFTRARVRAGQSLLVQGAGGGVATAAIRLAAASGLRVIVATRSEERGRRALEIGAHEVIGSGDRLSEVDVVIDAVGEATWKHSVAALRPGGTLVTCGASTGFLATTNLSRLFSRQLNLIGSTMGTREELAALVDLVVARRIEPVVDAVEPLADVRRQFERLVGGDVFGKLVVEA